MTRARGCRWRTVQVHARVHRRAPARCQQPQHCAVGAERRGKAGPWRGVHADRLMMCIVAVLTCCAPPPNVEYRSAAVLNNFYRSVKNYLFDKILGDIHRANKLLLFQRPKNKLFRNSRRRLHQHFSLISRLLLAYCSLFQRDLPAVQILVNVGKIPSGSVQTIVITKLMFERAKLGSQ